MKLPELLEELFRRNIILQIRNEHLHCDPPGAVPPELKPHLRRYETTIVAYMRGTDGNSQPFYPLSSAQKTIWFLDQLAPHPTSYKIRFEARILSKVNVPAIKTALQLLIDRHPALRTTYASLDGEPVQQIHDHQEVSFEVLDSSAWSREQLSRVMRELKQRPLNLAAGPLLQAYLFALPKGKYVFWLFLHHITVDFLSLEMLIDEFGRLYSCLSRGELTPQPLLLRKEGELKFPAPDQTYLDYMRWKLNVLAGAEGAAHLAYLRQLLRDQIPVLELPTDRPRPPAQTFTTSACFFSLGSDLTRRIKNLIRTERTSLYPLLASALFVLLHRYTGQDDLLIGAPRSEQGHKTFKNIVGLFDNPVPLRANLAGNPSFRSLLRTIHNLVWEAFDHEDYPSHLLPTQLHVPRDASHPPLFQVLLSLHEERQRQEMSAFLLGQGGERLEVGDLLMQSVGLDEHLAIFVDLQLRVFEEYGSLTVLWQYNSDLFEASTIERMGEHFQVLLAGIVENPATPLAELPLMTDAERHKILVEWNNTAVDYPQDRCIHELFEARAQKMPEAIAVVGPTITLTSNHPTLAPSPNGEGWGAYRHGFLSDIPENTRCLEDSTTGGDTEEHPGCRALTTPGVLLSEKPIPVRGWGEVSLTYHELNCRANQVAHYLRKLGVGPDVLVGICMERSIEMIVGILGILKAGGAYVPLDPTYPKERLAFMLHDAQTPVLLTQHALLPLFPENGATRVCLDTEWETMTQESGENLSVGVTPLNRAYVIYTSGSTGKPKGVEGVHQGLANLASAQVRHCHIQPSSRIAQFASLSFDASLWEIVMAFYSGATLYLGTREILLPGSALLQFLERYAITHITLPPSALAALPFQPLPALQTIIVAGETCPADLIARWSHGRRVINAYGPTEATVCATTFPCTNTAMTMPPPIGRPLDNTQLYILDQYLQPVPAGVRGELYIGGIGLARGYLNRPELTQQRFIPHPFDAGKRLYKSGDLARYLPDGTIEFLGRIDHQVKIRGFRIEPEEIETVLAQHSAVSESVVIVREDRQGNRHLTAYIVPETVTRAKDTAKVREEDQQITQWQDLFDELLASSPSEDTAFNIAGWENSYSGQPISSEEMREWAEMTVERILSLQPKRVLEIGCGTGLLLFRIAPQCQQYWGLDFSQVALDHVWQQVAHMHLPQVQLLHTTADDFENIPAATFDVLLLNSVAQYFPNIDYFLQVIAGMVQSAAPGGVIFIGDVRSLPLLELFHTSVQLYQAPATLSVEQLQHRIQTRMTRENELVIAPEFFLALRQRFTRISDVRILPKRGSFQNELSRFRYDVILSIETEPQNIPAIRWLDWQGHALNSEMLRAILAEEHPSYLGVTGIPNARLRTERTAADVLRHKPDIRTVAELRAQIEQNPGEPGIDPEALWRLEDEFPYLVELSWAQGRSDGAFDALFVRRGAETPGEKPVRFPNPDRPPTPLEPDWNAYANNPTRGAMERQLIPHLRAYLQERLPEYMIPAVFVLLDKLPLTPNGKINRQALPAPERTRPELATSYVAPRSELEQTLVDVWKDLLDLEQIGVFGRLFRVRRRLFDRHAPDRAYPQHV